MNPTTYVLTPFWLGYAVALAIIVGWAWKLSREGTQRDKDTDARESTVPHETMLRAKWEPDANEIPREAMWRAIERERGE